ncbi:hypothetical protein [Nocardioides limicola]|nr:hypothetical protein [Nocardioides sp. DJM-14]
MTILTVLLILLVGIAVAVVVRTEPRFTSPPASHPEDDFAPRRR